MSNLEPNFKDLTDRELLVLIADKLHTEGKRITVVENWVKTVGACVIFEAGSHLKDAKALLALLPFFK